MVICLKRKKNIAHANVKGRSSIYPGWHYLCTCSKPLQKTANPDLGFVIIYRLYLVPTFLDQKVKWKMESVQRVSASSANANQTEKFSNPLCVLFLRFCHVDIDLYRSCC